MTTKHTQGEWVIDPVATSNRIADNEYVVMSKDQYVGMFTAAAPAPSHAKEHRQRNEANAKLIAAAPELLEALTTVTSEIERLGNSKGIQVCLLKLADKNKDILLKATNKSWTEIKELING